MRSHYPAATPPRYLEPIFCSRERSLNGAPVRGEPGGNMSAEMDTQDATTTFGQNCKIGARLRCLDNTKGVFLTRHIIPACGDVDYGRHSVRLREAPLLDYRAFLQWVSWVGRT